MVDYKSHRISPIVCIATLCLFLLYGCQPRHTSTDNSLLGLHNQARQAGIRCGLLIKRTARPLTWNPLLAQVARAHSQEMFENKTLSHKNAANLNPGDRISNAGYQWASYAENIASGVYDNASVLKLWLNSSGHCKNIANDTFTEIGIAQVNGYWTAIYAKPQLP